MLTPNAMDQLPHCAICNAGNVSLRTIRLSNSGEPAQNSYWFDCHVCGYSSPGRLSEEDARQDVTWRAFGREA